MKIEPSLLVGNQIEIALAVSNFHVGQPVPFFRQRQKRLAEQSHFGDPDREFASLGPEQMPGDADQVPEIEQLE